MDQRATSNRSKNRMVGGTVGLVRSLAGVDGELSWSGSIRKSDIDAGLTLLPEMTGRTKLRETDNQGAIGLTLLSSRGRNPVYQFGEEFSVGVHVNRDAWLCSPSA